MIGTSISHYTITAKLGEGGMGAVYKAEDTKLKRAVALKFLPLELTRDDDAKERFVHEAQSASALDHPNICTIYEIAETEAGQFYIAMACYEGETLRSRIAKGQSQIDQALDIAMQVAKGLGKAHETGIVHRDIKPANIIITNDGAVKILDFGVAKLGGRGKSTKAGSTVGTLAYMSPEQVRGEAVDQRSDIWSLGAVIYEMLTGKPPFRGEYEVALMYDILNSPVPSMHSSRPDIPGHVQTLVSRMLMKDPEQRLKSAQEVIEGLKFPVTPAHQPGPSKSIAVLYFENMSSEKDSDYFCAGMTEDIITDLSKVSGLKVISRTDILPFRNKDINTRQLGEILRVSYILEGSVRKAGNKIRVTAQLIDVQTGFHVWAERFDRLIEDIFDVQNEISQEVVAQLRVTLRDEERAILVSRPTNDLRAYDFYMRGRDLLGRRGRKNTQTAILMFESALEVDNTFARAYAALAEAYAYMYEYYDGQSKWLGQAIDMNEKALALNPDLTEAHFGLAIMFLFQKRFDEAKRAFEQILREQPEHYDAHLRLGMLSEIKGDLETAITHYHRSADLKPYSEEPWMRLEDAYLKQGDRARSRHATERKLALAQERVAVNPEDVVTLSRMATTHVTLEQRESALDLLNRVSQIGSSDPLALYNCACGYALLHMKDQAIAHLRKAFEIGWRGSPGWIEVDSDLESLRGEPEFKELIARYLH